MHVLYKYGLVFLLFFQAGQVYSQKIPSYKIGELEQIINESDKPMIINFWATFCIPCIEEIPYFIKKANEYKNQDVSLLLVSLDMQDYYPAKISAFADKQKFNAPIAWLNETDADLFCPRIDQSWSGAIPATLFVNNKTGYRKFFEEQLTENVLETEIKAMLKE